MLTKEVPVDVREVCHYCTFVRLMFTFFSVTIPPSLPLLTFTVDKDLLFRPLNYFPLPSPLSLSHTHTHTHLHRGGVKPHREHCVSLIAVGKVTPSKLSAAVCVCVCACTSKKLSVAAASFHFEIFTLSAIFKKKQQTFQLSKRCSSPSQHATCVKVASLFA